MFKAGRSNLINHENYFEWLLEKRTFLAGEFFSIADIAYSAFLSSLDYLSELTGKEYLKQKMVCSIKSGHHLKIY